MDRGLCERFTAIYEINSKKKQQFADFLGIPSTTVSDIGLFKREPSKGILLKLTSKFGVNLHWMLTGEGDMFLKSPEKALVKADKTGLKVPVLQLKDKWSPGLNWRSDKSIWDLNGVFRELPSTVEGLFAFRVQGSSMLGAGIRHGDYVLFDSTENQKFWDGIHVIGFNCELCCRRIEFDIGCKRIFSVRVADLAQAFLIETVNDDSDRLEILGRVYYWLHPNTE
jgi:hypothetical protein